MNAIQAVLYLTPFVILNFFKCLFLRIFSIPIKEKKSIDSDTILITGAGSGVGRSLAVQFSKHSTSLVLLDINTNSLLETKKLVNQKSKVFIYKCDVSARKSVYEVAERIKKEVGKVDILVNNAGIVFGKPFMELTDEQILKTMQVNALGHFWMCKAFLPSMMEWNKGHIVSIVSIAGVFGGPKLTDYCASKFAALGFAESLELELKEQGLDGIKITTICPSLITTGLFEGADVKSMHTALTPDYAAQQIVNAVLEDEEFLFLPRSFYFMFLLKGLVPHYIGVRFYELTGFIKSMNTFKGRITFNNNLPSKQEAKEK
ncbi:short-chain dehydrogenase/reductase family 16C member 6-like [Uloborus diversus]|uniref:short-chain dehydrogenase/reductase family 16C member 6-like n=1 Tax=Uloborus diversus TaxID=327109 RepID=UPI0024098952|nr:short-chain dehydrogenase/reductase family 16C member 6-like [Uloborus diversus]